jgi:hypothetical protein
MTPKRVFAATMILGLCFGIVHEAHAIGKCSVLCRGKKEPCDLKCYLPNNFVTTCGELVGTCFDIELNKEKETTNKNENPNQKTK